MEVKPVSVPTEVILGCAAVVRVAAIPKSVTVKAVDVALSSMPVEVNVPVVKLVGLVPTSITVPPEFSV